jgi:hypothetical protein
MNVFYLFLVFSCFLIFKTSYAQPDLSTRQLIVGTLVYKDAVNKNVFYYLPNDIKIRTSSDSVPDFKFIMMRYTGTKLTGDQGKFANQNILKVNVIVPKYKQSQLSDIKRQIKLTGVSNVELKPIPISRMEAFLVLPFINKDVSAPASDSVLVVSNGYFVQNSSQWEEKCMVLKLDNAAAQIFDETLKENKTIMSLGYAYYTLGTYPTNEIIFEGFGKYANNLKELIQTLHSADSSKIAIVKTGVTEIIADVNKYTNCVKKVDVADYLPADYPTMEIYCFDFNNRIRNDLYAKKIEIEAVSVSGQKTTASLTFRNSFPDVYAGNLYFDYAVKLDIPPVYRIIEISFDGNTKVGDWIKKDSWNGIIDITTQNNN